MIYCIIYYVIVFLVVGNDKVKSLRNSVIEDGEKVGWG